MLAKLTSKNQLTLPKAVIGAFPGTVYFDVRAEEGRILLVPARVNAGDAVRDKLDALGITQKDVADAVRWARRK